MSQRPKTYLGQTTAQANQGTLPNLSDKEHADPSHVVQPRFWVAESDVVDRLSGGLTWSLGFRDITSAVTERTVIATVIPRSAVANNFPLIQSTAAPARVALLGASLSSFALDFVARQKVGGTHLNFFIAEQLPILPPETYDQLAPWDPDVTVSDWLRWRVLELTYTAWDLEGFARDLGHDGPPFVWDPDRRAILRAELDACFFHLYGIGRDDVVYIMGTFPVLQKRDESAFGEYRTARMILERYDAISKAIESGSSYTGDPK